MGLAASEVLTVRDLLYGLLLPSGNDAAVALAEHVAGSEDAFVKLMNEAAAVLGLAETHFANSHGLDDSEQRSSAADLLKLAEADLAFPLFAEIVAQPSAYAAGRSLVNTNQLLGIYRGADGVKTGTTTAAGECLVASATRGGHRLLAVVLGSTDRYGDAEKLFDYSATVPVIDTHAHIPRRESDYNAMKIEFGHLFNPYASNDLASAGMPFPRDQWAAFVCVSDDWDAFEPYWRQIRHGSYARPIRIALQEFYGVDDLTRDDYLEIVQRINAGNTPGPPAAGLLLGGKRYSNSLRMSSTPSQSFAPFLMRS
jgi:hypothetical protein